MRIVSRGMAITLAALSLTDGALAAPVETVLYSLKGGTKDGNFIGDGNFPAASLIADAQGALYGTTILGGSHYTFGTVFKLTPPAKGHAAWTETVLYSFTGGIYTGGSDGEDPFAGGGSSSNGTVFKLTPPKKGRSGWKETVLHSFSGSANDGARPNGLIADKRGALYGTTYYGGSEHCLVIAVDYGCGTVFKLPP